LLRESKKKCENNTYLTLLGHYKTEKKAAGVTTTTTEQAGDILGNNSNALGHRLTRS
jgi:hypothetical protein